jgi:hypothetical protein
MRPLLLAALLLSLAIQAHAQTQPTPSPGVRPRGSPAQETSVPTPAPPSGTTMTTGSNAQDPGVKAMNDAEKAKVENKGK